MAAKKTSSTVKTLQAAPKVAAKRTATKLAGGAKKTAARKAAAKSAGVAKKTPAKKTASKSASPVKSRRTSSDKTALDVLRLFIKTYEDL